MSDFGSIGGDVYTVPFAGGTPTNITRGSTTTNISMDWLPSGIRTVALAADTLELNTLDASGTPTTAWRKLASFPAGDGKVASSADGTTIATVVQEIGRASCRRKGCTEVSSSAGSVYLKKKKKRNER